MMADAASPSSAAAATTPTKHRRDDGGVRIGRDGRRDTSYVSFASSSSSSPGTPLPVSPPFMPLHLDLAVHAASTTTPEYDRTISTSSDLAAALGPSPASLSDLARTLQSDVRDAHRREVEYGNDRALWKARGVVAPSSPARKAPAGNSAAAGAKEPPRRVAAAEAVESFSSSMPAERHRFPPSAPAAPASPSTDRFASTTRTSTALSSALTQLSGRLTRQREESAFGRGGGDISHTDDHGAAARAALDTSLESSDAGLEHGADIHHLDATRDTDTSRTEYDNADAHASVDTSMNTTMTSGTAGVPAFYLTVPASVSAEGDATDATTDDIEAMRVAEELALDLSIEDMEDAQIAGGEQDADAPGEVSAPLFPDGMPGEGQDDSDSVGEDALRLLRTPSEFEARESAPTLASSLRSAPVTRASADRSPSPANLLDLEHEYGNYQKEAGPPGAQERRAPSPGAENAPVATAHQQQLIARLRIDKARRAADAATREAAVAARIRLEEKRRDEAAALGAQGRGAPPLSAEHNPPVATTQQRQQRANARLRLDEAQRAAAAATREAEDAARAAAEARLRLEEKRREKERKKNAASTASSSSSSSRAAMAPHSASVATPSQRTDTTARNPTSNFERAAASALIPPASSAPPAVAASEISDGKASADAVSAAAPSTANLRLREIAVAEGTSAAAPSPVRVPQLMVPVDGFDSEAVIRNLRSMQSSDEGCEGRNHPPLQQRVWDDRGNDDAGAGAYSADREVVSTRRHGDWPGSEPQPEPQRWPFSKRNNSGTGTMSSAPLPGCCQRAGGARRRASDEEESVRIKTARAAAGAATAAVHPVAACRGSMPARYACGGGGAAGGGGGNEACVVS